MTTSQFQWTAGEVRRLDRIIYQGREWEVLTVHALARICKVNLSIQDDAGNIRLILLDASEPIEITRLGEVEE